jgi:hypothetical protein
MLSQEQLEEYQRSSVLLLPGFFAEDLPKQLQVWSLELPMVEGVLVTFEKGAITRCEEFMSYHEPFAAIAGNDSRLAGVCGTLFGDNACLVKEKLNFKPPEGAGFMPHLDHPSLAFYLPPQCDSFITAMVAIDDMTVENGCLRVVRGVWNSSNRLTCVPPEGDPEVGGRAGAITEKALEGLQFEDIVCKAGDVLLFNGWVPHRSGPNKTNHCRRAVFFTYNPASHGDHRAAYYKSLTDIRNGWKEKLASNCSKDYENDLKVCCILFQMCFLFKIKF